MADLIERLRDAAANAAAKEYGVSGLLIEAAAAFEAAREDAERYRWLRSETSPAAEVMFRPDEDFGFYALWGDELDAAVDQAREKENEND